MAATFRTFLTLEALSLAAAELAVATIKAASATRERCSLVLSGGSTPRRLHELLATTFRNDIPWTRVNVFWGDERYVPHDDPASNYRMARETLLDHVPCPADNVHPMPTHHADPAAAARAYEATLRTFFGAGQPRFDLVLLGVGDDGHTASLFPGTPAVAERGRWVAAVDAPVQPATRLTLTIPILAAAARTCFLVAGASKAREVARARASDDGGGRYPAIVLSRLGRDVTWFVDHHAGGPPSDDAHTRQPEPAPNGEA